MSIAVPTVTKLTTTYRSFMNFFHNEFYANREIKLKREKTAVNLMDVIPLCDITKTYTDIYVNTQQLLLTQIYFTRSDMFRLLIQPFLGQLTIEQDLLCAHNMGPHTVYI